MTESVDEEVSCVKVVIPHVFEVIKGKAEEFQVITFWKLNVFGSENMFGCEFLMGRCYNLEALLESMSVELNPRSAEGHVMWPDHTFMLFFSEISERWDS